MPRSLSEILEQADELAARFEAFEPTLDQEKASVLAGARNAMARKAEAERDLLAVVRVARAKGIPWDAIGKALGTSGEAARQRYGPLIAS